MRGKRYILGLVSRLGVGIDIEVWEEGYSGSTTERKISESPLLRLDNADNGVLGSSLELAIQSEVAEDLIDFYTVDNKKFLFKVFRNSVLIWSGFSLPEKYQEDYSAAPYPVKITASDGLGILKDVPFTLTGQNSILAILKHILDKTELILPFHLFFNLTTSGQNVNHNALYNTSIYAETYSGMSCYDVLAAIMASINGFVRQSAGSWIIARYSDVVANGWIYVNDLTSVSRAYMTAEALDLEGDCRPDGALTMGIIPAKKCCLFTFPYRPFPSFITNYNFAENLTGWTYSGTVTREPLKGLMFAAITSNAETDYIRTTLEVQATTQEMSLSFDYSLINFLAAGANASFAVKIKLDPGGAIKHYLTPSGWSTTEGYIPVSAKINPLVNAEVNNFSVAFSGFPASGTLTIEFQKFFLLYVHLYVTNVLLNVFTSKGLQINATLAEKASSSASDVEVSMFDSPFGQNDSKILYNRFINANSKVWVEGSSASSDSYIKTIVRDYISHLAFARRSLTGNLLCATVPDLLTDNGVTYFVKSFTFDLMDELAAVDYIQALGYNYSIVISDPVAMSEAEQISSSSTPSTSGSGGSVDPTSLGSTIANTTAKNPLADSDMFGIADSVDTNKLKKTTWAQIKSAILLYLSNSFAPASHSHNYAASDHNHDSSYAAANHTHDYAASNHTHSNATESAAGFMSANDKQILDGATSAATADKLVKRDGNGRIAVTSIEINGWIMTID